MRVFEDNELYYRNLVKSRHTLLNFIIYIHSLMGRNRLLKEEGHRILGYNKSLLIDFQILPQGYIDFVAKEIWH